MKLPRIKIPKALHLHNGSRFSQYVMPYLVVLLTAITLMSGYMVIALQSSLIENCEQNGNPLRLGVQKVLENDEVKINKDIQRTFEIDYAQLFPTYPQEKLQEEIVQSRKDLKKELADTQELKEINAPVNCEKQF